MNCGISGISRFFERMRHSGIYPVCSVTGVSQFFLPSRVRSGVFVDLRAQRAPVGVLGIVNVLARAALWLRCSPPRSQSGSHKAVASSGLTHNWIF